MFNKVDFYYILPAKYINYQNTLSSLNINKGNLTELLDQTSNNKLFCREDDKNDIDYNYFIELIKLNNDICIYIVDNDLPSDKNIAGCCIFSIEHFDEKDNISIWGICVPYSSSKKYGTQLLNKLKQFTKYSNIDNIQLSAGKNYINFYKKNDFIPLYNDDEMDEESTPIPMIYHIKGGKKKNKRKIRNKSKRIKKLKRKSRRSRK